MNKKLFNARLKLSKQAYKKNNKARQLIAGAYVLNNKQIICQGEWGVIYNDIYDNIINIENHIRDDEKLNLSKIFESQPNSYECNLELENIDIEKLKIKYKKLKLQNKIENKNLKYFVKFYTNTSYTYVNLDFFIDVIESFENPKLFIKDKINSMLRIYGNNGTAAICPCFLKITDDLFDYKYCIVENYTIKNKE